MIDPDGRAALYSNSSGYKTGEERSQQEDNRIWLEWEKQKQKAAGEVSEEDIAASYTVSEATPFGYKVLDREGNIAKNVVEGWYLQTKVSLRFESSIMGAPSSEIAFFAFYQNWERTSYQDDYVPVTKGTLNSYLQEVRKATSIRTNIDIIEPLGFDKEMRSFITSFNVVVTTGGSAINLQVYEQAVGGAVTTKPNYIRYTNTTDKHGMSNMKITVGVQNQEFVIQPTTIYLRTSVSQKSSFEKSKPIIIR